MKDNYKKLSNLLFLLKEKSEKHSKKNIYEKDLEIIISSMKKTSQIIGGRVLKKFLKLEIAYYKFLDDLKFDVFLENCIDLKNELWEI